MGTWKSEGMTQTVPMSEIHSFLPARDLRMFELLDNSKTRLALFWPDSDAKEHVCYSLSRAVDVKRCLAITLERMKEWIRGIPGKRLKRKIAPKDWKAALIEFLKDTEDRCQDPSNTRYIPPEYIIEGNLRGWETTAADFRKAMQAV